MMVDIFPRKETEEEILAKEQFSTQTDVLKGTREQQDLTLGEQAQSRIESMFELNQRLIQPTQLISGDGRKISNFHAGLTRDLKLSNIPPKDAAAMTQALMMAYSLFGHTVWMGLPNFPMVVHAELEARLALLSSIDGFERKALISALLQISRHSSAGDKSGFKTL